jgi:hypothetical protein
MLGFVSLNPTYTLSAILCNAKPNNGRFYNRAPEVRGQMSRFGSLATSFAVVPLFVLVVVLVLIVVLVLECVSNLLVKNFRFSRTRMVTYTSLIPKYKNQF